LADPVAAVPLGHHPLVLEPILRCGTLASDHARIDQASMFLPVRQFRVLLALANTLAASRSRRQEKQTRCARPTLGMTYAQRRRDLCRFLCSRDRWKQSARTCDHTNSFSWNGRFVTLGASRGVPCGSTREARPSRQLRALRPMPPRRGGPRLATEDSWVWEERSPESAAPGSMHDESDLPVRSSFFTPRARSLRHWAFTRNNLSRARAPRASLRTA
jgi:hypothetical protein